jgi:hypothetical protein
MAKSIIISIDRDSEPKFSLGRVLFLVAALCIASPFAYMALRPAWNGLKFLCVLIYTS